MSKINLNICNKFVAALYKVESHFWRTIHRVMKSFPASNHFISGDGFRALADYKIDEEPPGSNEFIYLKANGIVFIRGEILPTIKNRLVFPRAPFVLITHNSDWGPTEEDKTWWIKNAPEGSIWFAQNCRVRHNAIVPIPIGLENKRLHCHGVVSDFLALRKDLLVKKFEKLPKILYGFAVENNLAERTSALESLRKSPISAPLIRVNSRAYRKILLRHMAVASPAGNGLDTHRTWEAIYLHTMPIVTRSRLTEEWPGFPWCVLDNWKDVEVLDKNAMTEVYKKIPIESWESPELFMPFWKQKIQQSLFTFQNNKVCNK